MERGNPAVKEKWRRILEEQEVSGLGAEKFCEQHGHVFHQFRYWKQRLRKKSPELHFAPVVRRQDTDAPQAEPKALIALTVGKLRIEVRPGFDRKLLNEVVEALGGDA